MYRRLPTVTLAMVSVLCGTLPALGATVINNPFGDTSTGIYIGMDEGRPIVVFSTLSNGCLVTTLGDNNGLNDDYHINGGSGRDSIRISGGPFVVGNIFVCGYDLGPLVYNGHYLDIAGLGNSDPTHYQQLSSGAGETWVFGGNGRDLIEGGSPMGRMLGGPGADIVRGSSAISNDWLEGQEGSDCLVDFGDAHFFFHCGTGWDSYVLDGASGGISCEIPANVCGSS